MSTAAVAFACIAVGILRFVGGAGVGGLWLAFIGWFLWEAARASDAQVDVAAGWRGVRVGDVMPCDCATVDAHTTLQACVEEHRLRTGQRGFIAVERGAMAGLITPHEVTAVPRER